MELNAGQHADADGRVYGRRRYTALNRPVHRHFMTLVLLMGTFLNCSGSLRPPKGPIVAVQRCGVATIAATSPQDVSAYKISYELQFSAEICTIHSAYGYEDAPPAVELRDANAAFATIELLPEPLWFVRSNPEEFNRVSASFRSVAEWEGDSWVGTVPAGDYYLIFRYVVGPCRGRLFNSACVARSEPFVVPEPIRFVIEF